MTKEDILSILKQHEQVLYLPKGQRKNPLTHGIVKSNYDKIADEILHALKDNQTVIKHS